MFYHVLRFHSGGLTEQHTGLQPESSSSEITTILVGYSEILVTEPEDIGLNPYVESLIHVICVQNYDEITDQGSIILQLMLIEDNFINFMTTYRQTKFSIR